MRWGSLSTFLCFSWGVGGLWKEVIDGLQRMNHNTLSDFPIPTFIIATETQLSFRCPLYGK